MLTFPPAPPRSRGTPHERFRRIICFEKFTIRSDPLIEAAAGRLLRLAAEIALGVWGQQLLSRQNEKFLSDPKNKIIKNFDKMSKPTPVWGRSAASSGPRWAGKLFEYFRDSKGGQGGAPLGLPPPFRECGGHSRNTKK